MNIEEATNLLWQSTQQNTVPVAALQKTLTMDDAYKVQLGILARRQQAGENSAVGKSACRPQEPAKRLACQLRLVPICLPVDILPVATIFRMPQSANQSSNRNCASRSASALLVLA